MGHYTHSNASLLMRRLTPACVFPALLALPIPDNHADGASLQYAVFRLALEVSFLLAHEPLDKILKRGGFIRQFVSLIDRLYFLPLTKREL